MESRILAAIFLVISALSGLFLALLYLMEAFLPSDTWTTTDYYETWGAINLVLSIGALMGAGFAFSGTSKGGAIVGAIMGIIATGVFWTGAVFGIIALVLLATSGDEFELEKQRRRIFEGPPKSPRY